VVIGACILYNLQSTDYRVGVTGNYWGHLDCQVLRAPQYMYLNLVLESRRCRRNLRICGQRRFSLVQISRHTTDYRVRVSLNLACCDVNLERLLSYMTPAYIGARLS